MHWVDLLGSIQWWFLPVLNPTQLPDQFLGELQLTKVGATLQLFNIIIIAFGLLPENTVKYGAGKYQSTSNSLRMKVKHGQIEKTRNIYLVV